jgi:hypothetical protein
MTVTTRKRVLISTVIVWCVGAVAFETIRIWTVLSGPPDLEEYVNHLDFQLLASAFLVVTGLSGPARRLCEAHSSSVGTVWILP